MKRYAKSWAALLIGSGKEKQTGHLPLEGWVAGCCVPKTF